MSWTLATGTQVLCLALIVFVTHAAEQCSEGDGCRSFATAAAILPEDQSSLLQVTQSVSIGSARSATVALSETAEMFAKEDLDAVDWVRMAEASEAVESKPDDGEVTFSKANKIKTNSAADTAAFFSALRLDLALFFMWLSLFTVLQRYFPRTFAWRATHLWTEDEISGEKLSDMIAKHEALPAEEQRELDETWESPYHWTREAVKKMKQVQDFDITEFFPAPRHFCRWDPTKPAWFRWIKCSLYTKNQYVEETSGLDAAMLLRFTEMSISMLVILFIFLGSILIPIYVFCGGDFAGKDYLSYPGIGNVVYNDTIPGAAPLTPAQVEMLPKVQWIYWLLAFVVWFVVIFVQYMIFRFQREFMIRRTRWMLAESKPRSTTLLVEGIPDGADGVCTDQKLKEHFEYLFGRGTVESAFVVKKLGRLEGLIDEWRAANMARGEAKKSASTEKDEQKKEAFQQQVLDKKEEMDSKAAEIAQYQKETLYPLMAKPPEEQVYSSGGKLSDPNILYATSGFVTFKNRTLAEMVSKQRIARDDTEFVMMQAPDPSDVIYHDLDVNETRQAFGFVVGWGLVAGLFFAYMPIVVGIGKLANIHELEKIEFVKKIIKATGLESTLAGVLSSLGLTIMTSFLPTFLHLIFQNFLVLRANRWSQIKLQNSYFWFLVVFVLLVTAIGSNLEETLDTIAKRPFTVFSLLANKMPNVTHFYMNYMLMQLATQGMNTTRYMNLLKYHLWIRKYEADDARNFSEPEDQDYYGLGSRSARFTFFLLVALVFGTICPLMHILVLMIMCACRLIYGYLMPCTENRKVDTGGLAWCLQLNHVSQSMLIYIVLMVGILAHRAESPIPAGLAAVSFFFWGVSYYKFQHAFHWESLAYEDVMADNKLKVREPTAEKYSQYAVNWKPSDEKEL